MSRMAWNKGLTKYQPKPCLCGCGEFVEVHKYPNNNGGFSYSVNKFIKKHAKRGENGFNPEIHLPRLCQCGCGNYTARYHGRYNLFIKKHENIGRTAWNKGSSFSIKSRKKMSAARLGKEPPNKISLDINRVKELYFEKMLTRQEVAQLLNVSVHVVKTRIKLIRGGKLDNPYHSPEFITRMRRVGVELFKRWETKDGPNKLEQLVYSTLDDYKVSYQKQVPLFNMFVVDVFFPEQKLILEIFGDYWHTQARTVKKDIWKKGFLQNRGYKIEEIWEHEIKENGVEPVLNKFVTKYNLI